MKSRFLGMSIVVLAMSILVLLPAAEIEAAKASADISLDSVTVSTVDSLTTVTLKITNNGPAAANIEVNVQALMCDMAECGTNGMTSNECTVPEINEGTGSLGAFDTADFDLIFALDAGNYIFVAKAVGGKGNGEDRNQAVVTAVIP